MCRYCPEEIRAVFFQPLMFEKITFLKNSLNAAIDGLEEMEKKTAGVADHLKAKLGLEYDQDIDEDTTEDMKKYLLDLVDSIISADMRAWDRIVETNQDVAKIK